MLETTGWLEGKAGWEEGKEIWEEGKEICEEGKAGWEGTLALTSREVRWANVVKLGRDQTSTQGTFKTKL